MSWGEEQQKEIETIRERKITVKLSDADCDRLARKCGEHGLTIGELIENFVGDLVGGTYSNGSDERDYADQWFERCWFGMFPEPTLLNHLLHLGYEPEHYLFWLKNVEKIKSDIEITKQNIAEPSDEWKDIVDVYKRQKLFPLNYPRGIKKRVSRAVVRLCSLPLILFFVGYNAVSYTHLDVYKRQATMSEGKMLVRPFRYSLMGSIVHSKMRK